MILELLEHALTPCDRRWRKLGYLREQIAIDARRARQAEAWQPHLAACKTRIVEAVLRCERRDCVLIVGGGLQHDLPLEELGELFDRVVLADLIHRPRVRREACRRAGADCRLEFPVFDVSGVLGSWIESAASLPEEGLVSLVAEAEPGLPVGLDREPDLVVSAGVASQLMLLPCEWLGRRRELGESLETRLSVAAFEAHLRWLRSRSGVKLLLTDRAIRQVPVDGTPAEERPVSGAELAGEPSQEWWWRLAPAPELHRRHDVEHRVGAWLF